MRLFMVTHQKGVKHYQSLEQTRLWRIFNSTPDNNQMINERKIKAAHILSICNNAQKKLSKYMKELHPLFTLHDKTHCLGVIELIEKLIPDEILKNSERFSKLIPNSENYNRFLKKYKRLYLDYVEICIIILAAFLHDIGMVVDESERLNIFEQENFKEFLKEYISINGKNKKNVILGVFLRNNHAELSIKYINGIDTDLLTFERGSIKDVLALVCHSHCEPYEKITSFEYDEQIISQHKIRVRYISFLLRIADILDFDRDRTPQELFFTILNSKNIISINEWRKHLSVDGWTIEPFKIQFQFTSKHPYLQKVLIEYIKTKINPELQNAHLYYYNAYLESTSLFLTIPNSLTFEIKEKGYNYYDLFFKMSKEKIMSFFMGDKLYSDKTVAIRELLQNSFDAIRFKKHIEFKRNKNNWEGGLVNISYSRNLKDKNYLIIEDNGIGMNIHIINNFLTSIGNSYYKSKEFFGLKKLYGIEFEPNSQFGIGFASIFMLSNNIEIKTQFFNFNELQKCYKIVIDGVNNILYIQEITRMKESGTEIKILLEPDSANFLIYENSIDVSGILKKYSIMSEIPINLTYFVDGESTYEERIEQQYYPIDKRDIFMKANSYLDGDLQMWDVGDETEYYNNDTGIEDYRKPIPIDETKLLYEDYSKVDNEYAKYLNGYIGLRILLEDGHLSNLSVDYAPELYDHSICLDGIFVSNENIIKINKNFSTNVTYLLNIRDLLKPPITITRQFTELTYTSPRWYLIKKLHKMCLGKLWEEILTKDFIISNVDWENFYEIIEDNDDSYESLGYISLNTIWNKLKFLVSPKLCKPKPYFLDILGDKSKRGFFISLKNIKYIENIIFKKDYYKLNMSIEYASEKFNLLVENKNYFANLITHEYDFIIKISEIDIESNKIKLNLLENISDLPPSCYDFKIPFLESRIYLQKFSPKLKNYDCIEFIYPNLNRNSALAQIFSDSILYIEELNILNAFLYKIIILLNKIQDISNIDVFSKQDLFRLYKKIKWNKKNAIFLPPYRKWSPIKDIIITKKLIQSWKRYEKIDRDNYDGNVYENDDETYENEDDQD